MKTILPREEVYKYIDGERDYQGKRWTESPTDHNHTPTSWLVFIEDYVNEAKHILSRESHLTANPKAMDIMRKVAALAVAAMENCGSNPR